MEWLFLIAIAVFIGVMIGIAHMLRRIERLLKQLDEINNSLAQIKASLNVDDLGRR